MRPSSVTVSDASGGVKYSNPLPLDYHGRGQISIQCVVTGTVNYTVQQTLDNIYEVATPTWFDTTDTNLSGATANKQGSYTTPQAALRVKLNSGTGSVTMTALQAGLIA